MNPYVMAYWQIVRDCMTELLDVSEDAALRRIRDFRLRLQQGPADFVAEIVYHEEPLRLAARLAEKAEPETEMARMRYREIMHRRGDEATALGTDAEVNGTARAA